jgi:hypothetical protein
MSPIAILLKLLMVHAFVDFVLQPDSMIRGKNRKAKTDSGSHIKKNPPVWPYWMTAHTLVHGGGVWLVTGSMALGLLETALHWAIDFAKGEGRLNFHTDQIAHLACKALYAALLLA